MKKILLFIFVLGLVFAFPKSIGAHSEEGSVVIHMYDDRYDPTDITINSGEKVIFENEGSSEHWPASNIHPTHRLYPGTDIAKCGTDQEQTMFDACSGIKPGGEYEFTFTKEGEWRYHDHLFPEIKGIITVKDTKSSNIFDKIALFFKTIFYNFQSFAYKIFPYKLDDPKNVLHPEFAEYEKSYDANISIDSEDIFTDKQLLYSYVKKHGPTQATKQLNKLSSTFGSCHEPAHDAGRFSYSLFGGEAFQKCSSECHSGCYHGASESYFQEKGVKNLVGDLNLLCNESLNAFFSHQCIHGIGHGLMAYADYDIHEALHNCDTLPTGAASCYSGVFMENIVGGLAQDEGHFTKYLNDDPHFPCTVVEDKYKQACYYYQSSRMVQLFNGDFAKVAVECGEIAPEYKSSCFASMGRDVGGATRGNPTLAIKDCSYVPSGQFRQDCLSGAVQDSFWDPSGEEDALSFCALLKGEEKSVCYNTIIPRATEVLEKGEAFKNFCQKVEKEFQNQCLSLI